MLEFKGGLMNGIALSAEDVRSIARLPAREVLTRSWSGRSRRRSRAWSAALNALIAGVAIQLQAIAD